MHVEIGNSALFAITGAGLRAFTGTKISRPEVDFCDEIRGNEQGQNGSGKQT